MQKIRENIFSVGANHPERRLFDALIPLPHGTSYNSYLVVGSKKTALIDTVDANMPEVLLKNLDELNISKIDFIIINHAEQDHSGALPKVIEKYPDAKVLCSEKCMPLLIALLHIPEERIQIVRDKETVSLGDKTLEFIYTPWVHWPETMVTYLKEEKILFTCDFFGSHYAVSDLLKSDEQAMQKFARIYFAEIMMPFRVFIQKNLETLSHYVIDMIAPSHGPIYKNPKIVMDSYKEWVSDKVRNLVIIPYVSMHGSTDIMVKSLGSFLKKRGVDAHLYDLTNFDLNELAYDLVDAATIVVGTPNFHADMHSGIVSAVYLVNALRPKTKFVSILGSFGWNMGKMLADIQAMIPNLKAEVIAPVIVNGLPRAEDFNKLEALAETIAQKHQSLS